MRSMKLATHPHVLFGLRRRRHPYLLPHPVCSTSLKWYRKRHKPNIHRHISSFSVFLCELKKSRLLVINICHVWSCSGIPSVHAMSHSHIEHWKRWLRVSNGDETNSKYSCFKSRSAAVHTGVSLLWSSYRDGNSLPVIFIDRVMENVKCRVSDRRAKD
jgi:hypothetical protein